jgi:hypothetical protein
MTQLRNIFLGLIDHLNTTGVCYAILHGWEDMAQGKISDVDLVLAAEDLARFEESLRGRFRVLNLLQYESTGYGFILVPEDQESDSALSVDVTLDYRVEGCVFCTGAELLLGRQRWNGIWVVAPRQEFAYLLIKKIYEKGEIPEHQRRRLGRLVQELGPEAQPVVSRLFGATWGERLSGWVVQGRWEEVQSHMPQLRGCLRRQFSGFARFSQLKYWLPEVRRKWLRWRYPTGLAVAVNGPSNETSKLLEEFKGSFPGVFRRALILPGTPGLLRRKAKHVSAPGTRQKLIQPAGRSWLRRLGGRLDYVLGYLFKVRPRLVRSTLVLYGGQSENAPAAPLFGSLAINLDHSRGAEELARVARAGVVDYLCRRYRDRRRIWFPGVQSRERFLRKAVL